MLSTYNVTESLWIVAYMEFLILANSWLWQTVSCAFGVQNTSFMTYVPESSIDEYSLRSSIQCDAVGATLILIVLSCNQVNFCVLNQTEHHIRTYRILTIYVLITLEIKNRVDCLNVSISKKESVFLGEYCLKT